MPTLSTHVLDAAAGGPRAGVAVTVLDAAGTSLAAAVTGVDGRITDLASGLPVGTYQIRWQLDAGAVGAAGGELLAEVAATLHLAEDRHYHVPLLASGVAAVVYLGV